MCYTRAVKIFYTTQPENSGEFLRRVLALCGVDEPILRTSNGKPYLASGACRFSLTHTEGLLAVAVSAQEVGLDAEYNRPRAAGAYQKRLTPAEQDEVFWELWTAKEAYIKYRGETLARLLNRLRYEQGMLFDGTMSVDAVLKHVQLENCTLCVCTRETEEIELIQTGGSQ